MKRKVTTSFRRRTKLAILVLENSTNFQLVMTMASDGAMPRYTCTLHSPPLIGRHCSATPLCTWIHGHHLNSHRTLINRRGLIESSTSLNRMDDEEQCRVMKMRVETTNFPEQGVIVLQQQHWQQYQRHQQLLRSNSISNNINNF